MDLVVLDDDEVVVLFVDDKEIDGVDVVGKEWEDASETGCVDREALGAKGEDAGDE